jgi:hypothetical protein
MTLKETGSAELAAGLSGIADRLDDVAPPTDVIVARARKLSPVATGRLSRSITGGPATGSSATVGTSVRYGLPVHFGVPSRNQRARPFLLQAVDAETKRIVDGYTDDVAALIAKEV